MEKVEVKFERFEELVRAETTLNLIKDVFIRSGASYTALDAVKMILGVEEGKE